MKRIIRVVWLAAVFSMLGRPAGTQTLVPPARPDVKPGAALGAVPFERRAQSSSQAVPQRRRDSLWNGTLVGAGLGAILGALGGVARLECSECAGFNVPLTFGVLGAGAGAAIGAGIDAACHDRSTAWASGRLRRVAVAPVFDKRARALVAFVRF
jgi:hypothetical protein